MPKQIEFEGVMHEFPDDFSDADIAAALQGTTTALQQSTPLPPSVSAGMLAQSTHAGDPMQPGAQAIKNALTWGGKAIAGMTGMGAAGREAVQHPTSTLLSGAVPLAAGPVGRAVAPAAKAAARGTGAVLETAGSHPWMLGVGALGGFGSEGALAALAASPAFRSIGRTLTKLGAPAKRAPFSARPMASMTEGLSSEALYRQLARKAVLTPAEAAQFSQLKRLMQGRASEVGRSYAAGGAQAAPVAPKVGGSRASALSDTNNATDQLEELMKLTGGAGARTVAGRGTYRGR